MDKKLTFSMAVIMLTSAMLEKAPTWCRRFDNGRFTLDVEASIGQVIGLGAALETKSVTLPCGHPFGGFRIDIYLLGIQLGVCLTSSYKAHEAHHAELQANERGEHPLHPLPITDEMLRDADIQGLQELMEMAEQIGQPPEALIETLPEPLRSEMMRRIEMLQIEGNPELTSKVSAAIDRIRNGGAGHA